MKKMLILILILAMTMALFTACGSKDSEKPVANTPVEQSAEEGEETNKEEDTDEESPADKEEGTAKESPAEKDNKPSVDKKEEKKENVKPAAPSKDEEKEETKPPAPSGSLSEIIDGIYAEKAVSLPVGTSELDLSDGEMFTAVTGLASSEKVKEAAYSESMIGSQAYSMVVVRVKKSKDAADVADAMLSGINPAKWICVEADDVRVAAYDDLVMLIMVSSQLEETVTGKEIVSAFKKVCGGSLDVSKKR